MSIKLIDTYPARLKMNGFKLENKKLTLEFDTAEMTPQQIRLIKSINMLLSNIIITDDESDYFESCAEMMKQIAAAVKQANFNDFPPYEHIPYAEQALEYSIDNISGEIHSKKLNTFDN
jgi:hypothetical protein